MLFFFVDHLPFGSLFLFIFYFLVVCSFAVFFYVSLALALASVCQLFVCLLITINILIAAFFYSNSFNFHEFKTKVLFRPFHGI